MTQVMLLQSIYSIGVIILDLPTGAFADRFGKKKSLMIGAFLWTVGMVWYGFSSNFWQFVCGELIVGTGSAFLSGADRAYIHGFLLSEHMEHKFKKVEGTARGVIQVAQAIGSLVGGLIGSISLGLTFITTGASTFASLLVASTFTTVTSSYAEKKNSFLHTISESIRLIQRSNKLVWYTAFFACFNGLVFPLYFFSQPLMQTLNIPIVYFGVIYFMFNIFTALGSVLTDVFETRLKNTTFLIMSVAVVLSVFIVSKSLSHVAFFLLWHIPFAMMFMNQTIITDMVLKIVPQEQAATILSFQSLVRRLLYAVVAPVLGIVYDAFGMQKALLGYAGFLSIIFGFLLVIKHSSWLRLLPRRRG